MAELNEKNLDTATSDAEAKNGAKAVKKPAKKKDKKPNIFKRIGKYFRECASEMKKVTWLSRKETFKSSLIVIVVTVALCVVIGLLDTVLELGVIGLRELSGVLGWK